MILPRIHQSKRFSLLRCYLFLVFDWADLVWIAACWEGGLVWFGLVDLTVCGFGRGSLALFIFRGVAELDGGFCG